MKKALLLFLLLCSLYFVQAQSGATGSSYRTALGVKVWDGAGITLKHFMSDRNAIEAIGYFYKHGFRLTGLYEIHGAIPAAAGLKWYLGPGAHIGFYKAGYHDNDAVIGIDGVLGLDYKFSGVPINMSLDWQPAFEFTEGFVGSWGGLGIRYTF
ncbi:MAG TPA: hypothetical protein VM888_02365 [Chitinophagaceae bacterium]|nr:hypothetical protein [Chitinophagaceae bacterium]